MTKAFKHYLGIDAGGTFTDFMLLQSGSWRAHKVLSTPDNPGKAILQGIRDLGLEAAVKSGDICIIHGSTVATNAALERQGARTAYIGNKGFKDLLTIGRQSRDQLYNLNPPPSEPPVEARHCLEVNCRRDFKGTVLKPLLEQDIAELKSQLLALEIKAVAINLLFSYVDDEDERRLEEALKEHFFVSRSSFVLPKYKEYERGIATWLNASLGPKIEHYIGFLQQHLDNCPVSIMQSSGGTLSMAEAAKRAVNLLLSGPAGGLSAVKRISEQCGLPRLISFDMGGTSTDVALLNGDFQLTDEGRINQWPVSIPMLDIATIGAGGGSIAWLDEAKMLHVGPQSAGANPGPACYGKGGKDVTVSDANLLLGRLSTEQALGGSLKPDMSAAQIAMTNLTEELGLDAPSLAQGIIDLAEQQMMLALNAISVKKGHDPKAFILCCFGGAGGLHVCSLAEKMGMSEAIVPANSGVLSAAGMLCAPQKTVLTQSRIMPLKQCSLEDLTQAFEEMERSEKESIHSSFHSQPGLQRKRSLDLRYLGQSYTLNVPFGESVASGFENLHKARFGHSLDHPIELVNLCLELILPSTLNLPSVRQGDTAREEHADCSMQESPVIRRDKLQPGAPILGPAIITEDVATTWIKVGWSAEIDEYGHLRLKRN